VVGLVSGYIEHWTYVGLLVVLVLCGLGLPLPEDVALLAGGFLVHRGVTRYLYTLAVSLIGVVTGDNSLFFLGRRFGMRIMRYFGMGRPDYEKKMEWMRAFLARHGNRTIFYARFLAGLRALIYLSAGSLGVAPSRFFFYDLLGALVSVPVVVSVGYFFGNEIEQVIKWVGGFDKVLVLAVVLSVAIYASRRYYVTRPARDS
jgi:membrane protein DedA with SNARE-associated domain